MTSFLGAVKSSYNIPSRIILSIVTYMIKLTTYNCVLMRNAFHVVKCYMLLLLYVIKNIIIYTACFLFSIPCKMIPMM